MTPISILGELNNFTNTSRKPKVLDILTWPSPQLKTISGPWIMGFKSAELQNLIDDMLHTVKQYKAVGLSAIQAGVPYRIMVLVGDGKELVFVNPKLIIEDGPTSFENEGCLSFPSVFESILREASGFVSGNARDGEEIKVHLDGLLFRAAQHELDHMNGVVFLDKMSKFKREHALKKLSWYKRKI